VNKSRSTSKELDKNDGCVLYINNLGQKCNEEDLTSYFNKAGKVVKVTLTREPYNK
jgi:RNA recognition motif-containing protein